MLPSAVKATIKATSACTVWSLERKVFQEMAQYYNKRQKEYFELGKKIVDIILATITKVAHFQNVQELYP